MNVAFLHGCCQTSVQFQSFMKPYMTKLQKSYPNSNFIFIEGEDDHSRIGKMWFKTELQLDLIGSDHIPDDDIEKTMDRVEKVVRDNNVTVLVGFSQGGNVVDTYLRLRNSDGHIQSVLILNGYSFPKFHSLVPTVGKAVFVCSDEDEIVKPDQLYTENYSEIFVRRHAKGHKINTAGAFVSEIVALLRN